MLFYDRSCNYASGTYRKSRVEWLSTDEAQLSTTKSDGMWKIKRKHLSLRTRMKRLVRKTIGFSKSTQMHDIVIGLFVNRYAFGRAV
jgi:insertion element IS1 protein InsB